MMEFYLCQTICALVPRYGSDLDVRRSMSDDVLWLIMAGTQSHYVVLKIHTWFFVLCMIVHPVPQQNHKTANNQPLPSPINT